MISSDDDEVWIVAFISFYNWRFHPGNARLELGLKEWRNLCVAHANNVVLALKERKYAVLQRDNTDSGVGCRECD